MYVCMYICIHNDSPSPHGRSGFDGAAPASGAGRAAYVPRHPLRHI